MPHLRQVAEGLGLGLAQVLVIAGYLPADGATPPVPQAADRPTLDEAIDYDDTLSVDSKDTLRRILEGLRAVESGRTGSANVTKGTGRRTRRRS